MLLKLIKLGSGELWSFRHRGTKLSGFYHQKETLVFCELILGKYGDYEYATIDSVEHKKF